MESETPLTESPATEVETSFVYTVVAATWLSREPRRQALAQTAATLLALVLGCTVYWTNWLGAGEWMSASAGDVFARHQYWRLWTTLFAHGDLKHLLSNTLLFYVLGYFLNAYFGGKVFPLAAFMMGGLINAFALRTYAPDTNLIGASGVVFWMGGAWLALYTLINTKLSLGQRTMRAIGVTLALFFPAEAFDPQVSYRTHMIGLALGIAWGLIYYYWRRQEFRAAEVLQTIAE